MRLIGHLENEARARKFGDFLYLRGIENQVEADANGAWAVWVADEDQIAAATDQLARYQAHSDAPEFQGVEGPAAERREAVRQDNLAAQRRMYDRKKLFPQFGAVGVGRLTFVLICACIYVATITHLGADRKSLRPFYITETYDYLTDSKDLVEVRHGEVWRLFTPVLLHFSPTHILFNMLWLFSLGSLIEARQGTLRFGLIVLGIAAISNAAQYMLGDSGPRFGGMSGVIYGLFGYIWIRGKCDPGSGLYMSRPDIIMMLIWLVLCMTGWIGPIANVAHTSGLVVGAGWGYVSFLLNRQGWKV